VAENKKANAAYIISPETHNACYCVHNYLYLCIIVYVMNDRTPIFLPSSVKTLAAFGENIKLARLRRRLTAEQVSERAGISRSTLHHIEKGSPSVALGLYFQVLFVLGLEKDLLKVAADDLLGRKLQDAGLIVKERGPKRPKL